MRRTKEDAEATRLTIMSSALQLFSEKGIAATSIAEIARASAVTRGAFYWHFKNKWDLFDQIRRHYAGPIENICEVSLSEEECDPLGEMAGLLKYIFINVVERSEFRQIFVIMLRAQSDPSLGKERRHIEKLMNQLDENRMTRLQNAVKRGQLPKDLDLDAGSVLVRAMVEGVVLDWLQQPARFDLADRAEQFVESIIAVLKNGAKQR